MLYKLSLPPPCILVWDWQQPFKFCWPFMLSSKINLWFIVFTRKWDAWITRDHNVWGWSLKGGKGMRDIYTSSTWPVCPTWCSGYNHWCWFVWHVELVVQFPVMMIYILNTGMWELFFIVQIPSLGTLFELLFSYAPRLAIYWNTRLAKDGTLSKAIQEYIENPRFTKNGLSHLNSATLQGPSVNLFR